jgi:hypothetical protein
VLPKTQTGEVDYAGRGDHELWCSDLITILVYLQDQDQPLGHAGVDNDNSSSASRVAIQTVWT